MTTDIYKNLCNILAKRKGRYPGLDISEFYALMKELFTSEEAEVYCAMPRGFRMNRFPFQPASAVMRPNSSTQMMIAGSVKTIILPELVVKFIF